MTEIKKSGFIVIWRDTLLKSDICKDHLTWSLFCYMLALANASEEHDLYSIGVKLKPGQFTSTIKKLSEAMGVNTKRTRNSIKKLKRVNWLDTQGANKYTLFTLLKWDDFQGCDVQRGNVKGKRGANEGQTRGKRGATRTTREPENKNKALSLESVSERVGKYATDCIKILESRVELAGIRPEDIAAELSQCAGDTAEMVDSFVRDCANMVEPPKSPIGYLRGYIRRHNRENPASKAITTVKASLTPSEMFRAWDRAIPAEFKGMHGISHADFADQLRIDLVDLGDSKFAKRYKIRASEARDVLNAWSY